VHEDGKFIFRADSMPDLVLDRADLEMTESNKVRPRSGKN
jgi:hypothetical protein